MTTGTQVTDSNVSVDDASFGAATAILSPYGTALALPNQHQTPTQRRKIKIITF